MSLLWAYVYVENPFDEYLPPLHQSVPSYQVGHVIEAVIVRRLTRVFVIG